jgi:hypothetical protein
MSNSKPAETYYQRHRTKPIGSAFKRAEMEMENYKVDLHHVLALELTIDPDLGKNQAFAGLADWRLA